MPKGVNPWDSGRTVRMVEIPADGKACAKCHGTTKKGTLLVLIAHRPATGQDERLRGHFCSLKCARKYYDQP